MNRLYQTSTIRFKLLTLPFFFLLLFFTVGLSFQTYATPACDVNTRLLCGAEGVVNCPVGTRCTAIEGFECETDSTCVACGDVGTCYGDRENYCANENERCDGSGNCVIDISACQDDFSITLTGTLTTNDEFETEYLPGATVPNVPMSLEWGAVVHKPSSFNRGVFLLTARISDIGILGCGERVEFRQAGGDTLNRNGSCVVNSLSNYGDRRLTVTANVTICRTLLCAFPERKEVSIHWDFSGNREEINPINPERPPGEHESPEAKPWEPVYEDIGELLSNIFNFLLLLGFALGLFFIVKAGYTLKTSEGHPERTRQGKEELTAAIVGTLFVGLSLVILRIIIRVLLGGDPGF
jgi:hypothetical protein